MPDSYIMPSAPASVQQSCRPGAFRWLPIGLGLACELGFVPPPSLICLTKLASFGKIHICQSPPCRVTHNQVSYIPHLACFVKGRATAEIGLPRGWFWHLLAFQPHFPLGFRMGNGGDRPSGKTDPHNRRSKAIFCDHPLAKNPD
jgi:hypothetical protein